ncbi:MAG: 6-pyruvoyl-tetrahydropterin synthase-related protein [Candidatus Promineifilaceae bacterium]|nr:6-pyruvoyl-tetrahydropterin synthase-related protein [Candidatus Promineifilaceae bacterium]
MSSWRKIPSTFWYLLLVTVLGLPLVTPLLRWTTVPCTHDGHLHIHRIAAMRHAWENGVLFSRWLPDLAFGYGYPFFVYREPTPLYAILGPHLLGVPLPAASNLFYILSILACGWFMFLWVRDISGSRAALVSSVAYMAAPYILLDALVRGNAPESLALPLLPLLLWIGRRWMIHGSAASFLTAVFSLSFLSLSHNISILIFVPLFFIYLLLLGWQHRLSWKRISVRLLLLFGLGLGMTLFYTAGALLEMDQVTLRLSTSTRNNDFHFNFSSWSEILAPAAAKDPNLLNPPLLIRLGWVPMGLAIIGISTLFWKRPMPREQRRHVIWMAMAAAIFLFMALPASLLLWEKLPLIEFAQFPWRFIGRAALPVAFLAGAPFAQESIGIDKKGVASQLLLVAVVGLLLLEAVPNLYPRFCEEKSFPTIVDVHRYEQATGLVGVDPEGSYFPRTVKKRPKNSPLEEDYREGTFPQRFDTSVLPEGATADITYGQQSVQVHINSPELFTARYLSFAFPGWIVEIDGERVSVAPGDPDGLITFMVPPGEHMLRVQWQSTPLRTILSLVGILALCGVAVTTVYLIRRRRLEPSEGHEEDGLIAEMPYLFLLGIGLLLFKLILVDAGFTPLNRPYLPPLQYSTALNAGGQYLNGYNLAAEDMTSGASFDIDLAWTTQNKSTKEYQSNVWLAAQDGTIWTDKETQRPRLYEDPPLTWEREAGNWVWDSHEVEILPGTPPGEYDIVATLFDLDTLEPLTFHDDSGRVVGPTAVIGQVHVSWPEEPAFVNPQYSSQESIPDSGLILVGFNQDRNTATPGELMLLTLFLAHETEPTTKKLTLQLVGEDEEIIDDWELPIRSDPGGIWPLQSSHVLREQFPLRIPAQIESGEYQFILNQEVSLAQLSVTAPPRLFEQPSLDTAVQKSFNSEVELTGYSILPTAGLAVELIWQAEQKMDKGYHVFVHLLDQNATIVAQSDSIPANWSRPTTGWIPGEYIKDVHELELPDDYPHDDLTIRVGLYEPGTGQRLPVDDTDSILLPLPS